ncbi:hypothetical protein RJT34_23436 [Clitoria ternatea]|uniref:Uncharacterized protein n=1 Tax=Clitoria ternatea TaxID=43366 RepID=A0AAN9IEZ5_CLITE
MLIYKFELHQKEGRAYVMGGPTLELEYETEVREIGAPTIPTSAISFTSFGEIVAKDFGCNFLVGKIYLQNVMSATKVSFNSNPPEANALKKSYLENGDCQYEILNQIRDNSIENSTEDDFLLHTQRKTSKELKDCKENCFTIVFGTITHVSDGFEWWLAKSCQTPKELLPLVEKEFSFEHSRAIWLESGDKNNSLFHKKLHKGSYKEQCHEERKEKKAQNWIYAF